MIQPVFISLPAADVARSVAFWHALGFASVPTFSGEGGACIVLSEAVSVMLMPHARFRDFTPKAVCDTSQAVEVLISIGCESRARVDDVVARALAAGGTTYDQPEDLGFMYSHSFVDPDGHGWGVLHLVPPEPGA